MIDPYCQFCCYIDFDYNDNDYIEIKLKFNGLECVQSFKSPAIFYLQRNLKNIINCLAADIRVDVISMSGITDELLLENLKKYFKHSGFKSEVQKNAIKNILKSE